MPRPPVFVDLVNGSNADVFLVGNLVVNRKLPTGVIEAFTQLTPGSLGGGYTLNSPVGVVTGVPAAGAGPGDPFQAVLDGEAIVRIENGLTPAIGQRLYVSPHVAGVATNVEFASANNPPLYTRPIGTVKELQSNAHLVLATLGVADSSDQQQIKSVTFGFGGKGSLGAFFAVATSGVSGGVPIVQLVAAGPDYGTVGYVIGITQAVISGTTQRSPLVYSGLTVLQMRAGLTLHVSDRIYLDTVGSGSIGTNVRPTTVGSFIVALGYAVDLSLYAGSQQIVIMAQIDVQGERITTTDPIFELVNADGTITTHATISFLEGLDGDAYDFTNTPGVYNEQPKIIRLNAGGDPGTRNITCGTNVFLPGDNVFPTSLQLTNSMAFVELQWSVGDNAWIIAESNGCSFTP